MIGLILLCLLIITQDRIQKFWLGIRCAVLKILNVFNTPFTTKHFQMWLSYLLVVERRLLCWMILMLSTGRFFAPGFCLISCKLGDSAFLSRGCGLLFAGCWRRVLLERSKMIISISNFTRRLYHGYDGQLGTTMIPMAASKTNFI